MQSRMDKYNVIDSSNDVPTSRMKKNEDLYEKIKTSEVKAYNVSENMSVIDDNIKSVNINKVHDLLDERYKENMSKRKIIQLDEIMEPTQPMDPIQNTREYDINAILEQAKQGKSIDYNKERLKKVRESQYEILNNIDLNSKTSAVDQAKQERKQQEENLKNLINTITKIEMENKSKSSFDTSQDLDLLSDLMGDDDEEKIASTGEKLGGKFMSLETIDITKEMGDVEETKEITKDVDTKPDIVIGGVQQEEPTKELLKGGSPKDTIKEIEIKEEIKEIAEKDPAEEEPKPEIAKTLSKLDIDLSSYDDFNDIDKSDKSSIVLKVIIFIVFILLIVGALLILNNLLGLDLFHF